MHIEEYTTYQESEVLALYGSVGWTAYTEQPEALRRGFAGSLLTLAARENGTLVGLLYHAGKGSFPLRMGLSPRDWQALRRRLGEVETPLDGEVR